MAPGRHFLATIRLDQANDLLKGKSPPRFLLEWVLERTTS